jgi:hypothetical protein
MGAMIELKTGEAEPVKEFDPFDYCVCGHSRRAHYRSYDDGTGQGGCAGMHHSVVVAHREEMKSVSIACSCEKFSPAEPPAAPVQCDVTRADLVRALERVVAATKAYFGEAVEPTNQRETHAPKWREFASAVIDAEKLLRGGVS